MPLKRISEKTYREAEGLNKSLLVPFMRSPKHYLQAINEPKKATESMNLGTALHAEILRPDEAKSVYAVMKKVDRRKTADKEYATQFAAENYGKAIIDEEQKKVVDAMREAVMSHPSARQYIERATHREQAMFAEYRATNIDHIFPVKAMADGIIENEGIIFDIKTTDNAVDFSKKVRAFRYDIQQIHYQFIGVHNGIPPKKFPFIVVENTPPYGVVICNLKSDSLARTADEWIAAMEFYAHCHQKQDFNIGYSDGEIEIANF
jgi:hypothetical protein